MPRYFRPHGGIHLRLFPCHHRPGSQVPYESLDKSHAFFTPDTAWPVSRSPPCLSQSDRQTLVVMPLEATAAYGGLKPPPTRRLRRAHLHLPYSMTLAPLLDTGRSWFSSDASPDGIPPNVPEAPP